MPDGKTPHPSNSRATIPTTRTPGSASSRSTSSSRTAPRSASRRGFPGPPGPLLHRRRLQERGLIARKIVEEHIDICLDAGINLEGINAEVAKGQWEFQIFGKGSKNAADQMWVARYILARLCEQLRRRHRVALQAHPRALQPAARLERLRHALELLDQVPAREGRQGVLREAYGRLQRTSRRAHRRLRPGEPPAPHRPPRDAVDRQVQLRPADRGASIRMPHSFVNATATRATSRIAVRTRPPTPTWSPAGS
jgi:glutamine synthetase